MATRRWLLGLSGVFCAATWAAASAAEAKSATWNANGAIAFVRAGTCDAARLEAKLAAAGEALVRDRATSFVAVDVAAFPENNIDMLGNPSPYVAAVEWSAPAQAIPRKSGVIYASVE
jgi:hypothetical protein